MATAKSTAAKKPAVTTKPAAKKTTAATTTKATTKKVTAKAATTKTATAKKPATTLSKPIAPVAQKKPAASAKAPGAPTPEQRYRMVQDAAYFIAEKNGFKAGSMDYWIAAEIEIETVLSGKGKK